MVALQPQDPSNPLKRAAKISPGGINNFLRRILGKALRGMAKYGSQTIKFVSHGEAAAAKV
jgi:hypothetical protein